jgi:hypothetical protein
MRSASWAPPLACGTKDVKLSRMHLGRPMTYFLLGGSLSLRDLRAPTIATKFLGFYAVYGNVVPSHGL